MALFRDPETGIVVKVPDNYNKETGENDAYKMAEEAGLKMDDEVFALGEKKKGGKFKYVPRSQAAEKLQEGFETPGMRSGRQEGEENLKSGAYQPKDISKGQSFGAGVGSGATMGFMPALMGVEHAITNKQKDESFGEAYRRGRESRKGFEKAAAEENPASYGAGQVTGGVGTALSTAGVPVVGAASGLKGMVTSGAAMGGLSGAGHSEADLTKGEVGEFAGDVAKEAAMGGALGGGLHTAGAALKQGYGMGKEVLGRLKPKQSGEAFNLAKTEGVNPAAKEAFTKNTEEIGGTAQRFKETGEQIRKAEGSRLGEALTPEAGGTFPKPAPASKSSSASDVEAIMADNKMPEEMKQKLISQLEQRGEGAVASEASQGSGPIVTAYKELGEAENALSGMLKKGGDPEYIQGIAKEIDNIQGLKNFLEGGEGSLNDVQEVKRRISDLLKGKETSGNLKDSKIRGQLLKIKKSLDKTLKEHSKDFESASENYAKLSKWLKPSPESGVQFPKSGQFKQEAKTAMVGQDMPAQAQQNIGKFREGMENLKTSLPEEQASKLKGLQEAESLTQQRYAAGAQGQGLKGLGTYAAGEAGKVTGAVQKEVKDLLGPAYNAIKNTPIGGKVMGAIEKTPEYATLFTRAFDRSGVKGLMALDAYLAKNDPNYEKVKEEEE